MDSRLHIQTPLEASFFNEHFAELGYRPVEIVEDLLSCKFWCYTVNIVMIIFSGLLANCGTCNGGKCSSAGFILTGQRRASYYRYPFHTHLPPLTNQKNYLLDEYPFPSQLSPLTNKKCPTGWISMSYTVISPLQVEHSFLIQLTSLIFLLTGQVFLYQLFCQVGPNFISPFSYFLKMHIVYQVNKWK